MKIRFVYSFAMDIGFVPWNILNVLNRCFYEMQFKLALFFAEMLLAFICAMKLAAFILNI